MLFGTFELYLILHLQYHASDKRYIQLTFFDEINLNFVVY
jgi:hypothetical protein